MAMHYTIGQLAREVGVPISTVRYYERRGLVMPDGRSSGNYRQFSAGSLDRLRFVRSAQTAGFTLSDIEVLLRFRDDQKVPCGQVQSLISSRLDKVTDQMQQLVAAERLLQDWLGACRQAERTGRCVVLEGLASAGAEIHPKSRKRP